MSGYGFGKCRLCSAESDYCVITLAQGCDFDCRNLTDLLTDRQVAELKPLVTPEWWLEERAAARREAK